MGGGALAALLVVSAAAWRLSTGRPDARPVDEPAATAPVVATRAASPSGSGAVPAASTASAAPVAATLRLRANATIASLWVNGRSVPVARPAFTVDVDVAGFGQEPSLSIDALADDGRRAAIAVPAGVAQVNLEFPLRLLPKTPPVRPSGPRPAAPAAPLAPSPYK
jgi:hypothetical protein